MLDLIDIPQITFRQPASRLQREIEELAARETRTAFLDLEATATKAAPSDTLSCSRMAVAFEGGPAGDVYSILVIVRREPPRD